MASHSPVPAPANPSPPARSLAAMAACVALAIPWIFYWVQGVHPAPIVQALFAGLAILGAAFLLSWAAEAFQMDVSQALALALLALIAVLPEYAVDAVLAYRAAQDPAYAGFAVANMTGANRLLIGLGWSLVVIIAWLRLRQPAVHLERSQVLEMGILLAATLYAFAIPVKGAIHLFDAVILIGLFALYSWAAARVPSEEPHLVGPAQTVGSLPRTPRLAAVALMFLFSAAVIFISAEPFAEGLIATGASFGVDEFLLVQWLAPLASEAPEFIVVILFAWRGAATAAMRALISSKVNQWTLLIATLPIVYSIGLGGLGALPLDIRQQHEILLTAAQSLFALILIVNMVMGRGEAVLLFLLFAVQLVFPNDEVRTIISFLYIGLSIGILIVSRSTREALFDLPRRFVETIQKAGPSEDEASVQHKPVGSGRPE